MKVCAQRFNTYLAVALGILFLCGCQTDKTKDSKNLAALRVHLQANPNSAGATKDITILRSSPVSVTITMDPILSEANILTAKVIDTPGGFAIEVQFDESSTLSLEQYSSANPGRHFIVFGQWGDKPGITRWLAAPLITRRISNGVLAFTPDMTRDEADQLVLGLNKASAKVHKGMFKQ